MKYVKFVHVVNIWIKEKVMNHVNYAQKEDLKRQLRQSTYDENLLLYPSQPWTCVEAEYDLGHSKVLGSQQISSISDRNHLSGINAGLERAVRLDDDASKGAKSKVGTRALRTSSQF